MTHQAPINHVTDTAFWVASLRAVETRRRDAVFQDPLSAVLAGEHGRRIARSLSGSAATSWAVVIRTAAIDRLIDGALQQGVDTVVNLGAGLDTRPYRLSLPQRLRWIEIDHPRLIQSKQSLLASHEAACRVERWGLDLADRALRNAALADIGAQSSRTLLIAEGVIPYWSNESVALLAEDCRSVPSFRYWILDFDNAGRRKTPARWADRLTAAPFLFHVDDWFAFFAGCGWQARDIITSAEESVRVRRPYPAASPLGLLMRALPKEMRRRILSTSGATLLERREEPAAAAFN
jgi:methyltransferase (TIGR00027 family)